jgi:hypothetical protein
MASTNGPARSVPVAARQRFVLTDPIAFRFLEEDSSTEVVARREILFGYECYLVEQWACSRTDPTFIITTFTGDEKSKVVVSILSIPEKESSWSPRLKVYFESLKRYNAKKKETPLGTIMVTNLSGFPSSLTVIPIPEGDVRAKREAFFVNENLKRLGCSGRVGLTLGDPTAATTAKFYQLYRVSDKIPLNMAVIELVKLCQVALVLFGELLPEYADGLLCDITEKAITDWWVEFGTEYYSIEPHDGVLGPTTVSALLGTLIGARNRLHTYGAPIAKDVFDIESTKRAIATFQKGHKMSKTRRFDRQTLARIHRSTAKAASGDGWFVPRAVKSTMAELSGKGGEMVMDMVGAGNKAGIAEVETVDIEQFVQHVQGDRAKWLWRGKPRKESLAGPSQVDGAGSLKPSTDDQNRDKNGLSRVSTMDAVVESTDEKDRDKDKDRNRLIKKPLEKASSLRPVESGRKLGRIKGAVGLSHGAKVPKDVVGKADNNTTENGSGLKMLDTTFRSAPPALDDFTSSVSPSLAPQTSYNNGSDPKFANTYTEVPEDDFTLQQVEGQVSEGDHPIEQETSYLSYSQRSESPSIAGSNYRGVDLHGLFDKNARGYQGFGPGFRRTQSFTRSEDLNKRPNIARWPKHLSFSLAADSILTWERLDEPSDSQEFGALVEVSNAERSLRIRENLRTLELEIADWVNMELHEVEAVRAALDQDQQDLDKSHHQKAEEYRELASGAKEVLGYERAQLQESAKETEVLGAKLDYEINVLAGKVEDVEDGVKEFDRQVNQVEERVRQLEQSMKPKERGWLLRMLNGIGKEDNSEEPATSK